MTTLSLSQVRDLDRIVSFSPLVVDYPDTERYVVGAAAILRRILGAWIDVGRLCELEGRTPDLIEIAQLRSTYAALAEAESFVLSATVTIIINAQTTTIFGFFKLTDGGTYPLEVTTGDAATALVAIGNS